MSGERSRVARPTLHTAEARAAAAALRTLLELMETGEVQATQIEERLARATAAAPAARAAKRAAKRATFLAVLREATFEDACAAAGYSLERGRQVLAAAVRRARVEAHREHPSHLLPHELAEWRSRRARASWASRKAAQHLPVIAVS